MKYMIYDLETEIHKSFKRTANPFDERNYIVARGWKIEGDAQCSATFHTGRDADNYLHIPDDVDVLVGHNIKFDLLYEMVANNSNMRDYLKRGGKVWCTQYAHYLLNGMSEATHMNSMDQIVESYGGRTKIDGMKELWNAGVQTSEIDRDMVRDYLIGTEEEDRNSGDIGNTELIYLGQMEHALADGGNVLAMIQTRMLGLLATTDMEFNGIYVDTSVAREELASLTVQQAAANEALQGWIKDIPEEVGFKWSSPVQKSCFIYGGTIRYEKQDTYLDEKTGELARKKATEKQPVMKDGAPVYYLSGAKKGEQKYKNVSVQGELKKKYQDFFWPCEGFVNPKDLGMTKGSLTDGRGNPVYSVDSDAMEILATQDIPFLNDMVRKVSLDKEIGTYYLTRDSSGNLKGMLTCVDPSDHIIHHSLNHTSTVTARLSSSNPNAQNIPRGDKSRVKRMFSSRFEGGVMGELDYSQLEVVVMGLLSNDKQLVTDLNNKVDFHCVRVAAREGCTYEEALRKCKDEHDPDYPVWNVYRTECKIFSFQRAYGAAAATIAASANMTVEMVEKMIKAEEAMYPAVGAYHREVEASINATAEPFRDPSRGYKVYRRGYYSAPTGTRYSWRSFDNPAFMVKRGIPDGFSLPAIQNYPTQGTGGEIMQMALGAIHKLFVKTDNFNGRALLVNTVHDCIWLDMQQDVADEVMGKVLKIMQSVPLMLKYYYGIDSPVDFPADAEIGDNMLELNHWSA